MSRNVKISAALVAVFALVIVVVAVAAGGGGEDRESGATPTAAQPVRPSPPASRGDAKVVASDPRRLGRAGNQDVTFTEFLDFECEACGAAFPVVEQLRREYAGRVSFNIRYFPLPSHGNSRNAAAAVEAAAQQGKLVPMYERMFETQKEWGEQPSSQAAVFRGYAEDLGLNMRTYDAVVASPKTAARVERDVAAGTALGVDSTPTFFIGEQRIEPQSFEELRGMLDAALRDG